MTDRFAPHAGRNIRRSKGPSRAHPSHRPRGDEELTPPPTAGSFARGRSCCHPGATLRRPSRDRSDSSRRRHSLLLTREAVGERSDWQPAAYLLMRSGRGTCGWTPCLPRKPGSAPRAAKFTGRRESRRPIPGGEPRLRRHTAGVPPRFSGRGTVSSGCRSVPCCWLRFVRVMTRAVVACSV
jgi:hypothetical protein